jgi:hypothetical protein
MKDELDNSLFGGSDVPTEVKVPGIFELKNHLKAGGSVAFVPKGSKAIVIGQEFNPAIKTKVGELEVELEKLKTKPLANQTDAAAFNTILKRAKQLQKTLQEERKLMTSVLDEEKKTLIGYEEGIINSIANLVTIINNRIIEFQKAELKKQQEKDALAKKQRDEEILAAQKETDRKTGIQKKIIDFKGSVIKACNEATITDIDEKIKKLSSVKILKEAYMEFLPDAEIMYQSCVTLLNDRKIQLMQLTEIAKKDKEKADQLQKEQEEKNKLQAQAHAETSQQTLSAIEEEKQSDLANSQMNYEFKVSAGEKIKGVQQRWTFNPETIDMALLPNEYKTFDEAKIKEAIATGARDIPGVEIFQSISNVSR